MMVTGLSHITFVVKSLERSAPILHYVLGAKEVYSSGCKTFSIAKEKFFLLGDLWVCLMVGEPSAMRNYSHVVLKIDEESIEPALEKIRFLGLEIKPDRPRVEGEGRSIYFYDFDDNLFELHTGTLDERLKRSKNRRALLTKYALL